MRLSLPQCTKQALPALLPRIPRTSLIPRRIVTTSAASCAPIDVPKIIVAPGSVHHNSLSSFLEYAARKNLDPLSSVYVGTHYEYTVSESLLRLGFSLFRTGGKSDRGIDLLGHWVLPTLREPLPVVVQCKSGTVRCRPTTIRELEGSFEGAPLSWRNKDVLGLLVTMSNASKGVLEHLGVSKRPLGFMKISRRGTIEQCLWNKVAAERGLEGVGVTVRYTPLVLLKKAGELDDDEEDLPEIINGSRRRKKRVPEKFRIAGARQDIQLTWMGSPIFPEREGLAEETMRLRDVLAHDAAEFPRTLNADGTKKAKTKKAKTVTVVPKRRGRPPGSRNKPNTAAKAAASASAILKAKTARKTRSSVSTNSTIVEKPKRGRPKGSKNKVKPLVDDSVG